uniref:Synaptic vesicle glycoprotein 2C-like n=1 Tax=Labrus bergylta TaxID=56723 RepID=A0A3Q3FCW5_9LABR
MRSLKIGSLNINGGRDRQKRGLISEISTQKNIDILFLQETHTTPSDETDWGLWWEGSNYLSHGTNFSAGVAILFRASANVKIVSCAEIVKGRLLIVRAEIEDTVFCFTNIYAPNNGAERVAFYTRLQKELLIYNQDQIILGGDFNCTLDFTVDRIGEEPHPHSSQTLNTVISHLDLLDTFRVKHPQSRQYTWVRVNSNRVCAARLDRVYISRTLNPRLIHCNILPVGFTDHHFVSVELIISPGERAKSFWHFNNKLLLDNVFCKNFGCFWDQWQLRKVEFDSLKLWWEVGKAQIRVFCQQYTSHSSARLKTVIKNLEDNIKNLEEGLNGSVDPTWYPAEGETYGVELFPAGEGEGSSCAESFPSTQRHGLCVHLQTGKHDEAWMVLKQIHDTNMRARGEPERVFTVNRIKIPKQLDELVEMQNESANPVLKVLFKIKAELRGIWSTFMKCFDYPVKDNTIKLAIVWFTLSFGFYGLSVWFPDVIKHLQADEYASRVKIHNNERIEDFTFNFTLENQIHRNGAFFKAVKFIDSSFINCYFEDVSSVGSSFTNCTIVDSFFYNTDIDDSKLTNSTIINSSFHHNKTGCQMTFDDDYSAYWVYFVNFLGTLAVLPGNIVSALLMDKIGRLSMLGGSMVLSGISCFFLWFGTSESMMIFMLCLYNGLSISAWNSLDVVTTELYPTDRRGTGFGFCNAMCKLAAVMGNLIFGSLVGITKAIPILLASSVLVCGGLVGLRLPDTRANVLM